MADINKNEQNTNESESQVQKVKKIPWYKNRKIKLSGIAAGITALVIAAIIVVNVIVGVIAQRYPMDLDMTSDSSFTMSDETADYVKSIDKKVTITFFLTEEEARSVFQTYYGNNSALRALEYCTQINPNITMQYIDLNLVPELSNKYDTSLISNGNLIVFECGENQEYISDADLYVFGTDATTGTYMDANGNLVIEGDQIERCIVKSLMLVTTDDRPGASIIEGHDEVGCPYFSYWIEQNGLKLSYTELLLEDIPEDTDFIVIPAPTTDYSQAEIDKLNEFLDRNGSNSIIVFLEASQPDLPNFNAFLEKWGIKPESGMIVETDSSNHESGLPELITTITGDAEDNFIDTLGNRPILTYRTRAMSTLFESNDDIQVETLLQTYKTTAIINEDGSYGEEQSFPVITRSFRTGEASDSEEGPVTDSVYVFATVELFNQSIIETYSGAINNESMATTLINTLGARSVNVDIPDRNITDRILKINQAQATTIGLFVFVIFVPLFILVTGFIVWNRRRKL